MHFDLGQPQDRELFQSEGSKIWVAHRFVDRCLVLRLSRDVRPRLV